MRPVDMCDLKEEILFFNTMLKVISRLFDVFDV